MANKKRFWEMLTVALIFGMVLLACPTDTPQEDTWTEVTSLDQLNGTWKGSYKQTQTMQEFMDGDEGGMEEMGEMFAGITVSINADITVTINARDRTTSRSGKITMTFSGENLSVVIWDSTTVWTFISGMMETEGVYVDHTNHSITMTQPTGIFEIDEDAMSAMLNGGLQINQNRTKIKMPFRLMEHNMPEMILNKQ
jgi:hypothetical protein